MAATQKIFTEAREWAVTAIVLLWATTAVAQPFVVPTSSMEDTILIGDHLMVDKIAYAPAGSWSRYVLPYAELRRGDIIVFRCPCEKNLDPYVKRVIGLPGDRIRVENKQVYVNGRRLVESYAVHKRSFVDPNMDNLAEITVPAGQYFAMGDNRDNSWDSRFWGFVPRENIIGKPWLIWWSYDAPTAAWTGYSLEKFKDLATNFFTKTRWNRTLDVPRSVEPQFAD